MEKIVLNLECKNFQEKTEGDSSYGAFEGYGAVFGNVDSWDDVIEKGAFKETLKASKKYPLLWHHEHRTPIGSFTAKEDLIGLKMAARIFLKTRAGQEAYDLLKEGIVTGLSIGYRPTKFRYEKRGGVDHSVRVLEEVSLCEVSVVTFPANDKAQITNVKSVLEKADLSLADLEDILRDRGMSRTEAKTFISKTKEFSRRDAEKEAEKSAYDLALSELFKAVNPGS